MQKNVGKNTKKLYFTTAIISFVLVLAISLTLIFTLGARSSGGSGNGNNSGTIGSVSTKVYNNTTELGSGGLPSVSTENSYNVNVKNTSDIGVYLRARVIVIGTTNPMIKFGTNWTYAADNYLYYNYKVASGQYAGGTTSAPTEATEDTLFKGFDTTATTTNLTVRFVVEALQEEAAVPQVTVQLDSAAVANANLTNTASSSAIQNGLLKYSFNLGALSSKSGIRSVSIANNGKQDLDVKFRIASSEWMVESAKVGSADRKVEWFPNAGYYQLVGKLAIGETATIILGDANKNNNINAPATTIDFTLQDYIVATDVYSLVDSNLQNVSSKVTDENYTYNIPAGKGSDLYVYSYNNVNKFVYVQVLNDNGTVMDAGSYTLNSAWGNFEGESVGVSGAVISPKSKSSAPLFTSAPTAQFKLKVWTAQTIDNPTIDVVYVSSGLNGSSNNYQAYNDSGNSAVAINKENVGSYMYATESNKSTIVSTWNKLAIKSNDSSDMLVRVSLSFAWGTYSGGTWTPNTDALGFSPSDYYGNGFSFNSEDQSLTYNYNLQKGYCTSALFENLTLPDDVLSKITGTTALKLSVMVEAIYAVGSQLDILKLDTVPTTSKSYYTSDDIGSYTSMTKTSGMIYGDVSSSANATTFVNGLKNYVVYVTNNFPVGVRVAVALQWGTYSKGVWTAATTDAGANSTVNLGEYLTSNWEFDTSLGGYNYKCSIPGKCATAPIFASDLAALATAISNEYTSRSDTTNKYVRVVIMAETTHKV